jgi:hypothetical protein
MDIGADEVGELIAVGQRFGTTHFFEDGPPTGPVQDNKYVWWFGPNHSPGGNPPNQNLRPDFTYNWPDQWYYATIPGRPYYGPSFCDISPHLLPDVHPWWFGLVGGPTNPIWQFWRFPGVYNAALYVAPLVGVINPPGALFGYINPNPPNQQYRWLDGVGNPVPTQFIFGGPLTFFQFGPWCQATTGGMGQDYDIVPVPVVPGWAQRYSVEFPTTTPYNVNGGSNLQSFLVKRP